MSKKTKVPKDGDRREDDDGWLVYRAYDEDAGGYWVREEDSEKVKFRVPMSCPACDHLLDNWKATYYHRWGVCNDCYYNFLDGRNLPKMSNEERAEYCSEKVKEKELNK